MLKFINMNGEYNVIYFLEYYLVPSAAHRAPFTSPLIPPSPFSLSLLCSPPCLDPHSCADQVRSAPTHTHAR